MPGVTLHFVLADTALHRLRTQGGRLLLDPEDPAALNAFYHGAVGPDLGYFPGGHRVLSDLAHLVRTGSLVRALIRSAETVREKAFAWGWLTHVLGDQAVHPVIGRGVGELLTGDPTAFVDGSSNPLAHLRVEMGLDAWYAQRVPQVRVRRLCDAFDDDSVGFLVRAYAAVYRVALDPRHFVRSHRAATRRVGQALGSMGMVGALMGGNGAPVLPMIRGALQAAYRNQAFRSLGLAYLNPVAPSEWLLEEVGGEVGRHADAFMRHFANGAEGLLDYNLDTGRPLAHERDHPGTRRAMEALEGLTGGAHGTSGPGKQSAPLAAGEALALTGTLTGPRRPLEA